jgi:hypothetical protein
MMKLTVQIYQNKMTVVKGSVMTGGGSYRLIPTSEDFANSRSYRVLTTQ